jgi:hypothetical protein
MGAKDCEPRDTIAPGLLLKVTPAPAPDPAQRRLAGADAGEGAPALHPATRRVGDLHLEGEGDFFSTNLAHST